jgi:hypothetical protein
VRLEGEVNGTVMNSCRGDQRGWQVGEWPSASLAGRTAVACDDDVAMGSGVGRAP